LTFVAACSPKISTNITKQYPSLSENDPVEIYNIGESMPQNAESLGTVSVKDKAATVNCDSLTMINLVKQQTRKVGGDAVLLTDYKIPSLYSNCYQFEGIILKTSNSNSALPIPRHSTPESKKERELPRFSIGADVGLGFRTNRISSDLVGEYRDMYSRIRLGLNYNVYADCFFADRHGIRFTYYGFSASTSEEVPVYAEPYHNYIIGVGTYTMSHSINYAGVSFVERFTSRNKKWLFNASVGLGYIDLKETHELLGSSEVMTGASIGMEYSIGAYYRIDKNLAIGANLSTVYGTLTSVKTNGRTYTLPVGQGEGLGRMNLSAGISYNF
jgi:hypothetical protein